MKCKGCQYLNWLESNSDSFISVTYICIHPNAKGVDKIIHGAKGYIISKEDIDKNKFLSKVGNVFQPVWCPLMDEGDYYE